MADSTPVTDQLIPLIREGLPSVISVQNASVRVGQRYLLRDIHLEVQQGQVLALVGPNGAGKSTLLQAISGEQSLANGSVILKGRRIAEWPSGELAKSMAVMPQHSALNFAFTVREVVELARIPHSTGHSVDQAIVDEMLALLDAQHLSDELYTNLSGGEQQRVQLARILAQISPQKESETILLLDEPSSSLDLAHQQLLGELLQSLAGQGVAIVVVLHDLNLAMSYADHIGVLSHGRLEAVGVPKEVLTPENLRAYFGVTARIIKDVVGKKEHIVLDRMDRVEV